MSFNPAARMKRPMNRYADCPQAYVVEQRLLTFAQQDTRNFFCGVKIGCILSAAFFIALYFWIR